MINDKKNRHTIAKMKYTKQEMKQIYGTHAKKYAEEEYWKGKKNIAMQRQSRRENKFRDECREQELDEGEYHMYLYEKYVNEVNTAAYPLGMGW